MQHPTPPRLGIAVEVGFFDTLGKWIFDHDRDIEIADFTDPDVLSGDTAPLIARYRDLLSGYNGNIGIHGPYVGFQIDSSDPEIRTVVKKRLDQGLDVAEALGATIMVAHSPFNQWLTQNFPHFPGRREDVVACSIDSLSAAVKRAEDIGCVIVLENCDDVDPVERRLLAAAVDSPSLKISVDVGHANLVHGSNGAPPVDYFLKDAGEMLAHVHLQDTDDYADRHWVPGEGSIHWASVFDAVAALKVKPRLIVEVFNNIHRIPAAVKRFEDMGLAC
ncbi:MAG: sugar phosphate isomerase/epimerase family protein [Paracoccaceae bacterium]